MIYYVMSCLIIIIFSKYIYRLYVMMDGKNKQIFGFEDIDPVAIVVVVCVGFVPMIVYFTEYELWFILLAFVLISICLCEKPSVVMKLFCLSVVFLSISLRLGVSGYYLIAISAIFPLFSFIVFILSKIFMKWDGVLFKI
ncbi:hypothetical protein [Methylohalobius crimeensis]|uniref:hypothetical protein n=1 Tax=Methylohalobius crimeensis TaxID=244365 RepID=UPI0003B68BED|nr:hypothetical protein [Methylohalobius crimeensis]